MCLSAVLGIGSALIGASSAKKAANAQSAAADAQIALSREMYEDTSSKFAPFLERGQLGMQAYMSELGLGKAPAGYGGFEASPGYQYRLDQGNANINALAGAKGGLNSGATRLALMRQGQGMASDEYGQYMNRLAGVSDMGLGAAGNQATAANAFAGQANSALANRGNAAAAGSIGVGNAFQNGIQNGLGLWQYQQNLNPQQQQATPFFGGGR